MQKQRTEVKVPVPSLIFIIMWIIFTMFITISFGIKNKHHRDAIEIYEEYYELDEQMDIMYRYWSDWHSHYGEEEFYLKFYPETYLRYLELKQIIGEMKKWNSQLF